jgi:hypothetical protein
VTPPDPWHRFFTLLTREYAQLTRDHGDTLGTWLFQERIDAMARKETRR